MGKTVQIRVDKSLINVFGNIGKGFADKIKREYNLDDLFIPYSLTSQILAAKYKGQKVFNFKIKNTGFRKGTLELD